MARVSAPFDLAPAEPEPSTLLDLLFAQVASRQLCDSVIIHRTTETIEEEK